MQFSYLKHISHKSLKPRLPQPIPYRLLQPYRMSPLILHGQPLHFGSQLLVQLLQNQINVPVVLVRGVFANRANIYGRRITLLRPTPGYLPKLIQLQIHGMPDHVLYLTQCLRV